MEILVGGGLWVHDVNNIYDFKNIISNVEIGR